jgi:hypothetical protein
LTTIAWRGTEIAADSALSHGSTQGQAIKIVRTRYAAYGLAGEMHAIRQFIDKITSGEAPNKIKIRGDFECLMLTQDGCSLIQRCDYPIPLEGEFWAIGSGADYAIGAMAASKKITARKAVIIATQYDAFSRPPIQWARIQRRK